MYWYIWVFMGMYGYIWVCMGIYGYVWVCMGIYGYLWICMGIYGYLWVCLGIYGYVLCFSLLSYALRQLYSFDSSSDFSDPTPPIWNCCTILALPISSEIIDRFGCSRCLNNHIDVPDMMGSFSGGDFIFFLFFFQGLDIVNPLGAKGPQ